MKLSVIIVNYNVKYFLEQCLDSACLAAKKLDEGIAGQDSNDLTEIIVVDNRSTDHSPEYLKSRFPGILLIENQENLGFSKANNQAIAKARGEYILLLNPDTVIGENALSNVCRFMDENPQAGALGVKMLDGYGQFLAESKRGFPSPWNSFCKMTGLSKMFPHSKRFGGYHLKYLDKDAVHPVDILAGAFMMVRKEAIEKTGYLDESFFMYGEDIDWSYRISRAGYTNYYFPEPIIHYKGESTKKDIKYVKHFYEAMLIFFNKHYPDSNRLFKGVIRLAIVSCGTVSAFKKIIKPFKTLSSERKSMNEFTFNKSITSYEEIIRTIDRYAGKKQRYKIFHPDKGITIGPNEVIIDNTI